MNTKIPARVVLSNPLHLLAFGFGSGLAPKAPGTFGTLVAVPLYLLIADFSLPIYLTVCFATALFGIYLCDYSSRQLKVHDHPGIVWDEIVGFFITMAGFSASWQNILLGFILFRFFDIIKPWPIKWADSKVKGGFGIMLDDVIAGGFAWLVLLGIHWLWF